MSDPVDVRYNDGGFSFQGGEVRGWQAVSGDAFVTLDQALAMSGGGDIIYDYQTPGAFTTPSIEAGSKVRIHVYGSGGSGESTISGEGGGSAAMIVGFLYFPETTTTWSGTVAAGAAGVTGTAGNNGNTSTLTLDTGLTMTAGGGAGGSTTGGDGGLPGGTYFASAPIPAAPAGGTSSADGGDAVEVLPNSGVWTGAGGGDSSATYGTGAANGWGPFSNASGSGGCGAPSVLGGDDGTGTGAAYTWQDTHWGAGSAATDDATVTSGTTKDGRVLLIVTPPNN